jgi:hypothetical protein
MGCGAVNVVSWAAAGRASGPVQPGEERAWLRLSKGEYRHVVLGMWARRVAVCVVWCGGVGEATGESRGCTLAWASVWGRVGWRGVC